jgi:hypothetical protein
MVAVQVGVWGDVIEVTGVEMQVVDGDLNETIS